MRKAALKRVFTAFYHLMSTLETLGGKVHFSATPLFHHPYSFVIVFTLSRNVDSGKLHCLAASAVVSSPLTHL